MKKIIQLLSVGFLLMIGLATVQANSKCEGLIIAKPLDPASNATQLEVQMQGTPPYNYHWFNGGTTASMIVNQPGTYCVTITDAAGCVSTPCYELKSNAACAVQIHKTANGGLEAFATGTPPFQYTWTTPSGIAINGASIIPNESGTYCIHVTDATGCIAKSCITISNSDPTKCEVKITASSDPNSPTLKLTAFPSPAGNSLPLFSFHWSTGATTQSIEVPTTAGKYCVTVTNGVCTAESCFEVSPPNPTNCHVTILVKQIDKYSWKLIANAKGTPPFTYLWDSGNTGPELVTSKPGEHCVTVIDGTGCKTHACVKVGNNVPPDLKCFAYILLNSNGTLTAFVAGVPPITIKWTGPIGFTSTDATITPPVDGEYCLSTMDGTGCEFKTCIWFIKHPTPLPCKVTISASPANNGTTGAKLVANAVGKGPFTYLWNTGETTQSIFVLQKGEYCVTATSADGCIATSCIKYPKDPNLLCSVIIEMTPSIAIFPVPPPELCAIATGTAPFTYLWNTGETTKCITGTWNTQYYVVIKDANGCESKAQFFTPKDPNNNTPCKVEIASQKLNTGGWYLKAATANVKEPVQYNWSTGATTKLIEVATPGTYCVTITDASDSKCSAHACITVQNFTDPDDQGKLQGTIIPNPTSGVFDIQLAGGDDSPIFVDVFTLQGKKMWSTTISDGPTIVESIDVTQLLDGIYHVVIRQNGKMTRQILLKQ